MLTTAIRDGNPAVCVKDRTLWARRPEVREYMDDLGDAQVDAIYEGIVSTFWEHWAPIVAQNHNIDWENVYQDGRSGGWLVVRGMRFTEYVNRDSSVPFDFFQDAFGYGEDYDGDEFRAMSAERERFIAFVNSIEDEIKFAGDTFIEHLAEAVGEKNDRREACLVRGES